MLVKCQGATPPLPIPKQLAAVASASSLTKWTNKLQEQIVGSGLSGARTFIREKKMRSSDGYKLRLILNGCR
jgi:hypothetical protein